MFPPEISRIVSSAANDPTIALLVAALLASNAATSRVLRMGSVNRTTISFKFASVIWLHLKEPQTLWGNPGGVLLGKGK